MSSELAFCVSVMERKTHSVERWKDSLPVPARSERVSLDASAHELGHLRNRLRNVPVAIHHGKSS
jgi:hypothetical protein